MISVLKAILESVTTLFELVINVLASLVRFIVLIPSYLASLISLTNLLPVYLLPFGVATLCISAVLFLINRRSNG